MDKKREKQIEAAILWAVAAKSPDADAICTVLESMPRRYQDIFFDRVIKREKWSKIGAKHHYSDRQLRRILLDAFCYLDKELTKARSCGLISTETWWKYFN
jgi:hypothetical protein